MQNDMKCPKCGSDNIGEGKFGGYARLMPANKLWSTGSEVRVKVCTDCGVVVEIFVKGPEKFKS